jgi:hypothetical protein
MNTLELLRQLETQKVLIAAEGTRLHWRGPARAMTPQVLAELKARRKEILALLRVEAALVSQRWDGAQPVLGEWRSGLANAKRAADPIDGAMIDTAELFLDGPHALAAAQAGWSTLEVWGIGRGRKPLGLLPFIASRRGDALINIQTDSATIMDLHGVVFDRPRALGIVGAVPFWIIPVAA